MTTSSSNVPSTEQKRLAKLSKAKKLSALGKRAIHRAYHMSGIEAIQDALDDLLDHYEDEMLE